MKKTLSIILAILMIVTTVPMAFAAGDVIEVNGTGFSDFDDAAAYVRNLDEPAEIKLLADIEVSESRFDVSIPEVGFLWMVNAETTIDLNGYTITFDNGVYFADGPFVITDTSEQGDGKIQADAMQVQAMMVAKAYLTLENGTLEAIEGNLHIDFHSEFNMTGGSIINGVSTAKTSVVNISGGTIAVEGVGENSPFALDCNKDSDVNITGGAFKGGISAGKEDDKSLSELVPDGYAIKDADGNYIDKNLFSIGNTVTVEKHNDHKFENCVCNICEYECLHKDTLVQVEAKANTCTEIGWEAYEYCTACDYATTYVEFPATGEHIDADGDTMCDNGGEQLTCEDCGRPVHDDSFVQNLVCFIIMFIKLIKTAF